MDRETRQKTDTGEVGVLQTAGFQSKFTPEIMFEKKKE